MQISSIVILDMLFDHHISEISFSCVYKEEDGKSEKTSTTEIYRRRGKIIFDRNQRKFLSHTRDKELLEFISSELGLC